MLRLIADAVSTNEIDATRLRAEIPNLRQLFDDALVRRDIATCAHLLQPLLEIASFTDWGVNGWADQALALPEAQHHPDRSILLAARAVDLMINGNQQALIEA